jgi:hypothetical protein
LGRGGRPLHGSVLGAPPPPPPPRPPSPHCPSPHPLRAQAASVESNKYLPACLLAQVRRFPFVPNDGVKRNHFNLQAHECPTFYTGRLGCAEPPGCGFAQELFPNRRRVSAIRSRAAFASVINPPARTLMYAFSPWKPRASRARYIVQNACAISARELTSVTYHLVGDLTRLCTQGPASLGDFAKLIDRQFATARRVISAHSESEGRAVTQLVPQAECSSRRPLPKESDPALSSVNSMLVLV